MGADFSVPKGNPGQLRSASDKFGRLGSDLHAASDSMDHAAGTVLDGWTGPFAAMYAVAAGNTSTSMEAMSLQLSTAGKALKKYAAALEQSQEEIRDYLRQYNQNQYKLDHEYDKLSAADRDYYKAQNFGGLSKQAELSENTVKGPAANAAEALSLLGTMNPAEKQPGKNLVKRISEAKIIAGKVSISDIKGATDPELALLGLVDGSVAGYDLMRWIKAGRAFTEAKRRLDARHLDSMDLLRKYLGGRYSRAQLQQWANELNPRIASATQRYAAAEEALRAATAAREAPLGATRFPRITGLSKGLGRTAGVVGIIGGTIDVFAPPDDHHGWRRHMDRIMGGTGAVGSYLTMSGLGGPWGEAAGITLAGISAGWTLGNDMVDHPEKKRYVWLRRGGSWLKHNTTDKIADGLSRWAWSTSHPAG